MSESNTVTIEVDPRAGRSRCGDFVTYNVDFLLDNLDTEFQHLSRYKKLRDALNSSIDPEEITQLMAKLLELECLGDTELFNLS